MGVNYKTPGYQSWCAMLRRCTKPTAPSFARYGGRGVRVCERWFEFSKFVEDMGPRPTPKHSLDRFPDINGHYEPGNCRWATAEQQANNRSSNRTCVYQGKTYTARELSKLCGVPYDVLRRRIFRIGMSVDEAVKNRPRFEMTETAFHEIRAAISRGDTAVKIAADFGCSESLVSHIKTGRRGVNKYHATLTRATEPKDSHV